MKWEPHDLIRIIALIGAIILFGVGAVMMWQGVAAEGAIDVKSTIVSGSLKTGSAGLFIVFLAFIVIVFVVAGSAKHPSPHYTHPQRQSKVRRLVQIFFVLLATVIGSVAMASVGYPAFVGLALLSGLLLVVSIAAILSFLEDDER